MVQTKMHLEYNQRLFSRGSFRGRLHRSRFSWFEQMSRKLFPERVRVVELGCFDGRLLEHFYVSPSFYWGFDAGWEGGLARAQTIFAGHADIRFTSATVPADLHVLEENSFDVGVALETLEHIPPSLLEGYIRELARVVNGKLIVSVPNEKGIVFLCKYLVKRIVFREEKYFTSKEIFFSTIGQMEKVERQDHKGFDYNDVIRMIGKYFDIEKVGALPEFLPTWLGFTVTIVARSKS